jgi:hypothetical protein
MPNNAYLVRAQSETALKLAQYPSVAAVIPFEPYFKIRPHYWTQRSTSLLPERLQPDPA